MKNSKFGEIIAERHAYAQKWKMKHEGKVIGCFCSYVPEEILYAFGVLPVRIISGHDNTSLAERHIYDWYCPFVRGCLNEGLHGKYNYLDGIVGAHSCIHMRGVFDSWEKHIPVSYIHHVYVPYDVKSPYAHKCLLTELQQFTFSMENWIGKHIANKNLDDAINIYNTNRSLISKVYELRKSDPPVITGVEVMEIGLSSMLMDKVEHNSMLQQTLDELSNRKNRIKQGIRVMVLGTENDDIELIRLIESLGANVVMDDYCTSTRYFEGQIEIKSDKLSAIASRYLNKPPCPEKDLGKRWRPQYLQKIAKDYNIQGAIITQQKFCDRLGWEIPILQDMFKQNGIQTLLLECDTVNPLGQFRTRIEAFFEMIKQ